jgi:predicted  nucleic acid-binding Zn-ribbon protein
MALPKSIKDVVPLRRMTPESVPEIEVEIADIARSVRGLGVSSNMERAKELLTSGLTAAYSDGAQALEHAVEEADEELKRLNRAVEQANTEMDNLKRRSAEHILHLKSKSSELTALVETRVAHLAAMAKWVEEQRDTLKQPFFPPAALPSPAGSPDEETHD